MAAALFEPPVQAEVNQQQQPLQMSPGCQSPPSAHWHVNPASWPEFPESFPLLLLASGLVPESLPDSLPEQPTAPIARTAPPMTNTRNNFFGFIRDVSRSGPSRGLRIYEQQVLSDPQSDGNQQQQPASGLPVGKHCCDPPQESVKGTHVHPGFTPESFDELLPPQPAPPATTPTPAVSAAPPKTITRSIFFLIVGTPPPACRPCCQRAAEYTRAQGGRSRK
jgi:hypothetical protein